MLGFFPVEKKMADRLIEKGIEVRHNAIHLVASQKGIAAKPHLLIRLFLAAARVDLPIHHRSKKLVGTNLAFVDDKVRTSTRAASAFLATLECDCDLTYVLAVMLETGLLTAYIPEFERVHTLAQHDLYHVYTVDRHSIQAVEEMRQVVLDMGDVVDIVMSKRGPVSCNAAP